jgi:hypothetical protein
MGGMWRCSGGKSGRMALAAALLWLAPAVTRAGPGDDDDLTKRRAQEVEKQQPRVVVRRAGVARLRNIASNVDRLVFGVDVAAAPRERLQVLLRERIEQVAQTTTVSEGQKQKLRLAGEGDIQHFLDRVEQLKTKAQSDEGLDWPKVRTETAPLRAAFHGRAFGGDSLFAKTLKTMLTPEQITRFQHFDDERRQFQHRAGVHMTVLRLSTALGLSDEQWRRLEATLLKETRPSRISGSVLPARYFGIVYFQMRGISPEKLQPIFEPWQWQILKIKIDQAGGFHDGGRANAIMLDED